MIKDFVVVFGIPLPDISYKYMVNIVDIPVFLCKNGELRVVKRI